MSCIPPENKPGIFPSLLEFEPIFQGYVISVLAVFPACVLLLLSFISGVVFVGFFLFFFLPQNVCTIIT